MDVLKHRLGKSDNSSFWMNKISGNLERDEIVNRELFYLGWTVIRFWGEDVLKTTDECIKVIEETIFLQKIKAED